MYFILNTQNQHYSHQAHRTRPIQSVGQSVSQSCCNLSLIQAVQTHYALLTASLEQNKQTREGQVTKKIKAKTKRKDRRRPAPLHVRREKEGYRQDAGKGQEREKKEQ